MGKISKICGNEFMNIGMVSCSGLKLNYKCPAEKMYQSELYKKAMEYSKKNYDQVYILSGKYGLLKLTDIIEPYNVDLSSKKIKECKQWSYKVYQQINKLGLTREEFYWHCGVKYRKYLMLKLKGIAPLKGLGIGYQLKWYKDKQLS